VIARRLLTALAVLVVATACRHPSPPPPAVADVPVPALPVEPPWVATLASVRTAVDAGHYALADTILATFEQAQAGTSDASESAFWRAMLRADPRNPDFTPAGARAALERYLASEDPQRRTEATIMLRLVTLSDSLRSALAAQRTAADARDRAREEELQKLRDDLQRTQAELDRIKRRLGAPKP
jgi:hypothetical protein